MDLKSADSVLYLLGTTNDELGGSHFQLVTRTEGGEVPAVDLQTAPRIFAALHGAIRQGLIRSCHDLSEGGLAVAAAEMAFSGNIGADILRPTGLANLPDEVFLFSESPTRFILEVSSEKSTRLETHFADLPLYRIGTTCKQPRLRITGKSGEWIVWSALDALKEAWQKPLRESF
jgi:phosphoribosylformylglycinamidine (FGAM) synthase-like enzyme